MPSYFFWRHSSVFSSLTLGRFEPSYCRESVSPARLSWEQSQWTAAAVCHSASESPLTVTLVNAYGPEHWQKAPRLDVQQTQYLLVRFPVRAHRQLVGDIGQTIYLSVPPGLYLLMELALVWEANESLYRLKFILNVTDIFFYSHAFRYSAILKHDLNMSTLLTIVHFCDLKKKFHSVTPYLYFQAQVLVDAQSRSEFKHIIVGIHPSDWTGL